MWLILEAQEFQQAAYMSRMNLTTGLSLLSWFSQVIDMRKYCRQALFLASNLSHTGLDAVGSVKSMK